jgi:hypothetical protein
VVELLPAQRDIRISQRRAPLSESIMKKHDATIVVCDREQAESRLAKLPFGATWQRL